MEQLPYSGESSKDRLAFLRYQDEIRRGKNLLQLMEINKAATHGRVTPKPSVASAMP